MIVDLIWFLIINILDLPKLTTILIDGRGALFGDDDDNRITIINGHESFDNMLIMKSMLKLKLKLKLFGLILIDVENNDNNCLDLPSLTSIQGQSDCWGIHENMGRVILESMIWFDLILQWLDIPNLTQDNIDYGDYPFYRTADVQATSRW